MLNSNDVHIATAPMPDPNVVSRILEKEAVLVLPLQGEVKVLNELGARVWALIDGSRTIAEIVDAIVAEYEITQAVAENDILEFIQGLHEKKIVTL